MTTRPSQHTMRLRSLIAEIVAARDEENFERLMAAIDEARDETTLMAFHDQGWSLTASPAPATQSPQGHAAAPQAPEAQPRNSAEDVPAEAGAVQNRILIATIALIVVLAWINGCASVWPVSARAL